MPESNLPKKVRRNSRLRIFDPSILLNGTASFLEAMNIGDQVSEVFFDFGLDEIAYEALEGQALFSDQRE